MKRRVFITIIILFLLFSVLPTASADNIATISVHFPEMFPKTGEIFDIDVILSNNPGFCAVNITLQYDRSKLNCVKVTVGDLLPDALSISNPSNTAGASFAAAAISNVYRDGKLATFSMYMKDSSGLSNIELIDIELTSPDGKAVQFQLDYKLPLGEKKDNGDEKPSESNGGNKEDKSQDVDNTEILFGDIEGHWGEKYILQAAALGLLKGYPNGNFGPNDNVTRGQFVVTLYRYSGSPRVTVQTPFNDISNQSDEFKNAIAWAYENGLINGVSSTLFAPNAFIQRQEAVKILYAYAGSSKIANAQDVASYNQQYSDANEVADWAKASMYWAISQKIVSGTSASTLSPTAYASRAQLAKILVTYIEWMSNN